MNFKKYAKIAIAFLALPLNTVKAQGNLEMYEGTRPPQYVAISFDGSYSLPMWEQTRAKARDVKGDFTYFLSGVYFLSRPEIINNYVRPDTQQKGRSDIGFADTFEDIRKRLHQVIDAISEGNEMGSHVNGHYDGGRWTYAQWDQEFKQFTNFVTNVFSLNNKGTVADKEGKMKSLNQVLTVAKDNLTEVQWKNSLQNQLKGFRAPLLSRSKDTDRVLVAHGYTYDCSQVAAMNHWPNLQVIKNAEGQVMGQVWNFALAEIPVYGTSKKSISMDYNFYYNHSKGQPDPNNEARYEESYYQSLMNYFHNNYYGSRAPIHIGNHFSVWNGGAYFKALMRFASTVSQYPEVKIVNYTDLQKNLEEATRLNLYSAWSQGQFPKYTDRLADARVGASAKDSFFNVTLNFKNETQAAAGQDYLKLYLEGSGPDIYKFIPSDANAIEWNFRVLADNKSRKLLSQKVIPFADFNQTESAIKDVYASVEFAQNSSEVQHFGIPQELWPTKGLTQSYLVQLQILAKKGLVKVVQASSENDSTAAQVSQVFAQAPHELLTETRTVTIDSEGRVVSLSEISEEDQMLQKGDAVEAHDLNEEGKITESQLKAILK